MTFKHLRRAIKFEMVSHVSVMFRNDRNRMHISIPPEDIYYMKSSLQLVDDALVRSHKLFKDSYPYMQQDLYDLDIYFKDASKEPLTIEIDLNTIIFNE